MEQFKKGLLEALWREADEADGTSDPYVVAKLPDNATARTQTINKTLEPKFDETLEFNVENLDALVAGDKCLKFAIFDKNFFVDVPLGSVEIPLAALRKRQSSPVWTLPCSSNSSPRTTATRHPTIDRRGCPLPLRSVLAEVLPVATELLLYSPECADNAADVLRSVCDAIPYHEDTAALQQAFLP